MKQFVIASVVGAILVFVFQALSWMVLPIHTDSMRYTPAQDSLLSMMSRHLPADGVYALPFLPPEKMEDPDEQQKFSASTAGKPWALVQYHQASTEMSGGMLGMGFLLDFLAVALVVCLLGLAGPRLTTFGGRFLAVMAFAGFTVLQSDLMSWNWWSTPGHFLKGEVLDHLLAWAVCGVWLGWYLGRKKG